MARKVIVTLVDDYDGSSRAEVTVQFGLDGALYAIDLSIANAEKLRGHFEPWLEHARKTGRTRRSASIEARQPADPELNSAIRAWANKHGYEVSSRGRISAEVIHAYREANA